MIPPRWLLRLLGDDRVRERNLADAGAAADRVRLDRDLSADERRFRARMDALARVEHVELGTTAEGQPYRMALADVASLPGHCTAATGAGKSRFVGALMSRVMEAIVRGAPLAVVHIDGKGEGAEQQLVMVAALAARLPGGERQRFLANVHTLRFFDPRYLPAWPLLAPVAGVPVEAQADAFAEVLSEVVADATVGPRQRASLAGVAALALEFSIPLPALPWLLSSPADVAALAARSSSPLVRLELSRFEREPQGSIDGLLARLGVLLRAPSLKAVLAGENPFEFSRCFEPGNVTTISFGGADLGARAAVRAMGSLAISALANAAFDPRRTVRGTTLIVIDEPQAFGTSVSFGQIDRLITLGRSFGAAGVLLLHQGATQLPNETQLGLGTNVVWRALGRSARRDVEAASEWLPRTGRVPRPRAPGARLGEPLFLDRGQEERHRVAEIGRLPVRHFLVADRRADFAPRIIRAPDHDPPPWSAIPADIADAVARGSSGVPRAILEARVRAVEESAAARFAEGVRAEGTRGRRGNAVPTTPDIVGTGRGSRRGGVP
ncbi:MAG: hypothetical protein OZ928_20940 [Polyangiaceae bacterium]|nr:hypothetical protein [Polyangiaceae bacterium]